MSEDSSKEIAVVFGSGGGIGFEIIQELKKSNQFSKVYGLGRNSNPNINIFDEKSYENVANEISKHNLKIKLLINAIGFLHDDKFKPEKKFQEINIEYIKKSFSINTIPTALILKYFTPHMENKKKSVIATLSARVGSISDNYLGGWYSYRASKAALNQLIRTASIEYKRTNKNLIVVALHPGTVNTNLSMPFLRNKKYQTTEQAAKKLINVMLNLNEKDSGLLLDYNKNTIPY
ncbi:MAG: C-factor [Rickettsiales bacterium]|nr:C-factor [Rickettsiales bacterium]OUV79609.1 MAG: hypothetical protein CBC91_03460 [Rickettsiales bacterium TMED131]|tara:strand:+ start:2887 stop:3588 length:702 start_codon:yes stop_codon:yes gene_type:complete